MNFLNLLVGVGVNASGFQVGMKQVEGRTKQTANFIKGEMAKAFGYAAIIAYTQALVQAGGRIQDLSDKTDLSTDTVQALDYAATLTGASFDDMASAIKRLTIAQTGAINGEVALINAFRKFGVTMEDLRSKNPEQLFRQIAQRIKDAGLESRDLSSFLLVMGKSADSLLPAMKNGVGEMVDEFHRLGMAIDREAIEKLDKMGDMMDKAKFKTKQVAGSLFSTGFDFIKSYFGFGDAKELGASRMAKIVGDPITEILQKEMSKIVSGAIGAGAFEPRRFMSQGAKGELDASGKPWGPDRIHLIRRNPEELSKDRPSLSNWQRLGAAVRSADTSHLKNIERFSERTADNTRAMLNKGNFGAESGVQF